MSEETSAAQGAEIRVWDLFVRLFHWSLVAAFFIAYLTEGDTITLHVWAGYVVGVLVVLRILWGFVGTRHARFSDFAYGPRAALRYMLALVTFRSKRYIGHSPAGAIMVYALIVSLLVAVATGMLAYGAVKKGPFAPLFAGTAASMIAGPIVTVVPAARADDNNNKERSKKREGGDGFWKNIHELFAGLTMFLVLLHIGGVVLASLIHRENLPRAMFTGRKRP